MQTLSNVSKKVSRGFTLLELLIVIAILAILAAVVIIVLNPAQTLAQARDSQRLSDLATLKSAISLYLTTKTNPDLDDATAVCFQNPANGAAAAQIAYSKDTVTTCPDVTSNPLEGADVTTGGTAVFNATDNCFTVATASLSNVDGTGWIPVKLTDVTGGSPLSNLPLDPTNTVATVTDPIFSDFVYRYACQNGTTVAGKPSNVFELSATLESNKYKTDDDLDAKDGGDEESLYEVGTSVKLMGASAAGTTEY